MFWYWAIAASIVWVITVAGIAACICRKFSRASRNPIAWIPFFLAGPALLAILIGVYILLVPISILGLVIALVAFPFSKKINIEADGITIKQRVGGTKRTLRWSDIAEWKRIESAPFPTHFAILKTGQSEKMPHGNYEALPAALAKEGISYTIEEDYLADQCVTNNPEAT